MIQRKYTDWILLLLAILFAVKGISRSLGALSPEHLYNRDFVTVYLMARCTWTGDDPTRSLRSLAEDHLGVSLSPEWRDDPAVLPPPSALITAPMGLMDFKTAAYVWWFLDTCMFICSILLLLSRKAINTSRWRILCVLLFLLGIPPVYLNLYVGQVVILIFLLLVGFLRSGQVGREGLAGAFLGSTILLKFLTWPMFLAPLVLRKWRTLFVAAVVISAGYVSAALVFGFNNVIYFFTGLPKLGGKLLSDPTNFSIVALVHRIFVGTHTWGDLAVNAPPLVAIPALARPLSAILQIFLLTTACWMLRRRPLVEWSSIMICLALLVGPVTRDHYFILATIPVVEIIFGIRENKYPYLDLAVLIGSVSLLVIPHYRLLQVSAMIGGYPVHREGPIELPFWPAAVSMLPIFGLMMLTWLAYRYSGKLYTEDVAK
jgi:hypothetical protein